MKTYAPFSPISRPTFRKTTTDVVFKFFAYETNCYTEGYIKKKILKSIKVNGTLFLSMK